MTDAYAGPIGVSRGEMAPTSFEEVFRNLSLLLRRSFPIFGAWIVLLFAQFVLMAPNQLVTYVAEIFRLNDMPEVSLGLNLAAVCGAVLQWAGLFVIGSLTIGLHRAFRKVLADGPESVGGVLGVLNLARARLGWVMLMQLVVTLMVCGGSLIVCIPGIALTMFLAPALYLVAATDDDFATAFTRSFTLVVNNIVIMLVFTLLVIVFFVLFYVVQMLAGVFGTIVVAGAGVAMNVPEVSALATPCAGFLAFFIQALIAFPAQLVWASVATAMEMKDSGDEVYAPDF